MKPVILVAGATGNLGGKIIRELLKLGAEPVALVRAGSVSDKIAALEKNVRVMQIDMTNMAQLMEACTNVSCVVSALQGLHEVIVDTQTTLLNSAIAAHVPRFIPSDYASDFTKLPKGENRNFDLRRTFHEVIDKTAIHATSILNGAFAEILQYGTPLLNLKDQTVGYWQDENWRMDFTTMDNTAAFTAAAAIDEKAPRILRIAGFQISAAELAVLAESVKGKPFKLVRMGSLADLAAYNKKERAAHPEGEKEVFPRWQSSQYIQSMFSVQLEPLDNNRYRGIEWTGAREVIAALR